MDPAKPGLSLDLSAMVKGVETHSVNKTDLGSSLRDLWVVAEVPGPSRKSGDSCEVSSRLLGLLPGISMPGVYRVRRSIHTRAVQRWPLKFSKA